MSLDIKNTLFNKLEKEKFNTILCTADMAEKFGCNIYLIGGVVRDLIMDKSVCDIDIAVEGDAIEFVHYFMHHKDCKIVNIQQNLRTAKVKFSNDAEIDFASTREEKYSNSGVLPQPYNFGCPLEYDVKRRDFTINTLAVKLTGTDKFKLIDYFNGYNDIINQQIKILHKKSFYDDPSRIIRALKFSVRLNFKIEDETYALMEQYLDNPGKDMPLERVKNELKQYFSIKSEKLYPKFINTKAYKLLSGNIIKNPHTERIKLIDIKDENVWFIYFAALTVNSDYEDIKLNLTTYEKKVLNETKILLNKKIASLNDNKEIYNTFIKCADLSIYCYYVLTEDTRPADKFLKELKNIKVEITGKDLINLGLKPSAHFNEIFEKILEKKLTGEITTKEQEFIFIKETGLV